MSDYAKKTNKELQEILESRGLPTTGKKADLVARLNEADQKAEPSGEQIQHSGRTELTSIADPAPATEDSAAPAENAAPAQTAKSVDQTGAATEAKVETTEEAKSYALHLAASDIDREMEKRKARAERFNTGAQSNADATTTETATPDTDALKNLERAKRFGAGQTAIGMLDDALPNERGRGKKRGAGAEASALDDPGLKKNFSKAGRFGNRKRGNGSKPTGVVKSTSSAYNSDKDRQAADARKKRFAQS